jgi:hypothetical protein
MYYKDTNNTLHFLESAEFEYLLPADCTPITDEEAQAIQAEIEANQPVIIPTITMRQARMMLLNEGLLDEVNLAITTDEQKIWWDYSTTVERNHPLVDAVLTALGKTSAEIDTMFIGASQL